MKRSHPLLLRALAAVLVSALVAAPTFAQSVPAAPSAELAASPATDAPPSAPAVEAAPAQPEVAPTPDVAFAPEAASSPEVSSAAGEQKFAFAELPNFHRVDDKLYRGGQPGKGGMERLKSLGVQTVLDLRFERSKGRVAAAEAKALGLRYVQVPMYGFLRPTNAQIQKALDVIRDPAAGPVFVHCERGSDRTGVVVACYRVSNAKWTAQRAIDEAMGHGMYRAEWAKRSYIRDFSARGGR